MPLSHRVQLSVFPLGSSEPQRALAAIRATWVNPAWVASREINGAWLLEAAMEAPLAVDDEHDDSVEAAFTKRLSMAIWRKLGRYVRVVVDAGAEESEESCHHELGRSDYLMLMRVGEAPPASNA
ncbi:hypothetical protein FNU76_16765 [Chitinimonas arctica]|uniref:Uncharacterized protein n=1 Tax=Chitinimonas arctica TaxID=2594795 RepID=A0A516SI86_9NEIS|nr:hypothetical protein [Chitinimonas arctica]QDQ27864.1 hypothetical protein FNU76_16765 [Chitinimonas arctica]